jgi:hypothetical protein
MMSKKCLLLLIILGLAVVSGCGKPKVKGLVPVRGTVTYKSEPLEGAAVCFTPKEFQEGNRLATGKTDGNGRFELRTIGERGILPGEYSVIVVKNEVIPRSPQADPKTGRPMPVRPPTADIKSLIPKRYNDPNTSGLNTVVGKSGLTNWHVELVD